jgi:hypothetical protein
MVHAYALILLTLFAHAIKAGALHEIYDATCDMHTQFVDSTTQIPANTDVYAGVLRAHSAAQAMLLVDNTEAERVVLKQSILSITGTPAAVSHNTSTFIDKSAVDGTMLTLYELLKTILLMLNQMAP